MASKKGFTLIELLVVVAIVAMLVSIVAAKLKIDGRRAHPVAATVVPIHAEGGDGMFRFAEVLIVFAIVWIIANLLHYAIVKASGSDVEETPMAWLFGLSSSWLRAEEKRRTEKTERKGR